MDLKSTSFKETPPEVTIAFSTPKKPLTVMGSALTSVTISTSAPLSGGGDLSANRTISVDTSQSISNHAEFNS